MRIAGKSSQSIGAVVIEVVWVSDLGGPIVHRSADGVHATSIVVLNVGMGAVIRVRMIVRLCRFSGSITVTL